MKPELRSLIPKLNRYLLLLLVFICSLSVFLLLYPISSKSPQSDLDNNSSDRGIYGCRVEDGYVLQFNGVA